MCSSRIFNHPVNLIIPYDSINAPVSRRINAKTKIIFSDLDNFISPHLLLAIIFLPSEYQSINPNEVTAAKRYAESS